MSADLKLEIVRFRDHEIAGIRDTGDGEYDIPFKPLCTRLNLAFNGQFERLRRHHWATVRVIRTVAEDGKEREMVTINRKTFVMWLATLAASRIKNESVRSTIELYQAEAVEALDRHFFGGRAASPPARNDHRLASIETNQSLAASQIRDILDDLDQMKRRLALVDAKASYAEHAVTGASGFRTLHSWAKQRGIHLTAQRSRVEGEVCMRTCVTLGIEPGKCPRADGRTVPTYPTQVLELWLVGYLRRQDARPSLFSA